MNQSRFDELTQQYLLDDLSEEETEELEKFLAPEKAVDARRRFRRALRLDSHLAEASLGFEPGELNTESARRSVVVPMPWLAWGAIAAMTMFGVFLWRGGMPEQSETGIARIIRIEGEASAGERRSLANGDELFAGDELTMEAGLIELAYRETGVHVLAMAPLTAKLESTSRVYLDEGEMKLVVPPQGVGFVVETAERKITDLGTSFVVTTRKKGSKVLVLDGAIMVGAREGGREQMMAEGDLADFDRSGAMKLRASPYSGLPELPMPSMNLTQGSLSGIVFGFEDGVSFPGRLRQEDVIGREILPLIRSGFRDRASLRRMKQGSPHRFAGVAGSYVNFPKRSNLEPYSVEGGWLAWYHGRVTPPGSGRYRFWGYADNQLLVAIDGEPVFEGSRYDSIFRKELGVPRRNHPALPCLNAVAGFAAGPWIEVGSKAVQIDILFGETAGTLTSALLLIEREGEAYEETFWGQAKWPLFLTEVPNAAEVTGLESLRRYLEGEMMGSFSIAPDAIWKVEKQRVANR